MMQETPPSLADPGAACPRSRSCCRAVSRRSPTGVRRRRPRFADLEAIRQPAEPDRGLGHPRDGTPERRGLAVRGHEPDARPGVFLRRHRRGDRQRAGATRRAAGDRADLVVRPQGQARRRPGNRAEAGRRAVLEGSVRKAGERLRITVQLIDVADGYHIWSDRFDRALTTSSPSRTRSPLASSSGSGSSCSPARRAGCRGGTSRPGGVPSVPQGTLLPPSPSAGRPATRDRAVRASGRRRPEVCRPPRGDRRRLTVLGLWDYIPPGRRSSASSGRPEALELDAWLADTHLTLVVALALAEWDWEGAHRHSSRARGLRGR